MKKAKTEALEVTGSKPAGGEVKADAGPGAKASADTEASARAGAPPDGEQRVLMSINAATDSGLPGADVGKGLQMSMRLKWSTRIAAVRKHVSKKLAGKVLKKSGDAALHAALVAHGVPLRPLVDLLADGEMKSSKEVKGAVLEHLRVRFGDAEVRPGDASGNNSSIWEQVKAWGCGYKKSGGNEEDSDELLQQAAFLLGK